MKQQQILMNDGGLGIVGSDTLEQAGISALSSKQESHVNVVRGLMVERNIETPFDQSPSEVKSFFNEVKTRIGNLS